MACSDRSAESCLGVVLAGGQSRRMGRDKALLQWNGCSMMEHALARFRDAGIGESVVSGNRAEYGGIPDAYPGEGPLGGLLSIALQYPGRRLLAVPVDMPRLPAAWLRCLAESHPEAAALHYVDAVLPMRLDATTRLIGQLSDWLENPSGPRALRHLLREFEAVAIAAPGPIDRAFDNANTPDDWTRIIQ